VDWWPGDFNANDFIGQHRGKIVGGVTFSPGEVGNAFTFDGTGQQVTFGSAGQFNSADFTVAFWMKTGSSNEQALLEKRADCAAGSYWSIRVAGAINVEIDGASYLQILGNTNVADGNLHHVAVVRQGTGLTLYVDSAVDGSGSSASTLKLNNNSSMVTGASVCDGVDGTMPLNGQLDEIQIFNVALSGSQVAAIYTAGAGGICK